MERSALDCYTAKTKKKSALDTVMPIGQAT